MRRLLVLPLGWLVACGGSRADTTGGSESSSTGDPGETTTAGTLEPTTGGSSGESACPEGQETCPCDQDDACGPGLVCYFSVCVAPFCELGTLGCPCDDGTCGPDLACNSGGACQRDGACAWVEDGFCDVPDLCPPGSDVVDCCATPFDGSCEEESMGGSCPDGTDAWDCGYCPWQLDGECDEAAGTGLCPVGTDVADCCATQGDGICEEEGMGGACPVGTDLVDCNYCPTVEDGVCDEIEVIGGLCPPGTDVLDCCATPKNGVCEEVDLGGKCPPGSDLHDCGYCPWTGDGECDEPEGTDLCGEDTDPEDCT